MRRSEPSTFYSVSSSIERYFLFQGRRRSRRRLSVKDLPVTRPEVLAALHQNNLDEFFVEYSGYFTNHLVQATVALYNLGASKVTHFD